MKEFITKLFKLVFSREFIMYGIMGVLATLVNWGVHAVTVGPMKSLISNEDIALTVTTFIAVSASVIFAFFTNKIFVFESHSWEAKVFWREFTRFIGARVLTGILEIGGVPLLVKIGLNQKLFGIDAMVAKIAISFIVIVLNYVFSKLFIFTKKAKH